MDNEALQGIAHNPIEIDGKTIDPAKEPELFLRSLLSGLSLALFPCNEGSELDNSESMADGRGFEPRMPCGIHAFQACAIDHSATHPFTLVLALVIVLAIR